jgi:hypothetical protein
VPIITEDRIGNSKAEGKQGLGTRLLWFVAIYAASVAAFAAISGLLEFLLPK